MSRFDNNNIIPRYSFIAAIMTLLGIAVVLKAAYIMTVKHDYWMEVAQQQKFDSLVVAPNRGNILSDDGELMASSLPEYKMYMDFKVGGEKKDSLWNEKVDSICMGLHEIFPEKSVEEFKRDLEEGHQKMSQNWPIWPKRVDYNTFQRVKALPIFNMPKLRGGFHYEENNARRRPFGTLAYRTVGDMYGAKDSARFGLELAYDSLLRGKQGITHKRKVMNEYLNFVDVEPTDGYDIMTTLNVQMQDIAEKAVEEELKLINGEVGVAIVMEVATGDVKAIVNLEKCGDGVYRERRNHAVADLLEPGSVFKTASMMVALDDGVVDTSYRVNTGNGQHMMYGAQMNDHNRASGGYGTISFSRALQVSSNIGISYVIDEHYKKNPERYVEGLHRIGIAVTHHPALDEHRLREPGASDLHPDVLQRHRQQRQDDETTFREKSALRGRSQGRIQTCGSQAADLQAHHTGEEPRHPAQGSDPGHGQESPFGVVCRGRQDRYRADLQGPWWLQGRSHTLPGEFCRLFPR